MLQEEVVCKGGDSCRSRLHFCNMIERNPSQERVKRLLREPTHYCKNCGRTANDPRYLCRPAMLD